MVELHHRKSFVLCGRYCIGRDMQGQPSFLQICVSSRRIFEAYELFLSLIHICWKDAVRDIHSRFPQLRVELQNLNWHDCFGRDDLRDAYLERNGVEYRYPALENVGDEVLGISFYTPFQEIGHSRSFDVPPEEDRPFQEIEAILAKDFPGMFESVRSMPRMIELGAAGCGKGATARWLAGQLGRTVLYCAGDAPHDLPMLLEADERCV